jgi:hypothetical protein
MSLACFVITTPNLDPQSENEQPVLYWNNGIGWTSDLRDADVFNQDEIEQDQLDLPIGGKWQQIN